MTTGGTSEQRLRLPFARCAGLGQLAARRSRPERVVAWALDLSNVSSVRLTCGIDDLTP